MYILEKEQSTNVLQKEALPRVMVEKAWRIIEQEIFLNVSYGKKKDMH